MNGRKVKKTQGEKGHRKPKIRKIPINFLYSNHTFSQRIDDLRKPEGKTLFTLEELSKHIEKKTGVHISSAQLGKYEDSDIDDNITLNKLLAIADFYDVSIEYLVGRSDVKSNDSTDKYISKKLGLSDDAIKTLSEIKRRHLKFQEAEFTLKIINYMLSDTSFLTQLAPLFLKIGRASCRERV